MTVSNGKRGCTVTGVGSMKRLKSTAESDTADSNENPGVVTDGVIALMDAGGVK
jgi:hypothetical protein